MISVLNHNYSYVVEQDMEALLLEHMSFTAPGERKWIRW